ncbi:PAS domain S-box protein [Parapedobacter sp. 10938]|uniref:PAS domain S-box protein n=1 Tax=Parapedobacter flavus TaxID=3110225 RepID=UPI002DBDDCA4|nr:PAS domain S-box protein [Parapedobacter sp. 10938]MEC3878545.1 PAS domain S-box protein [Parapedobacter sp. 10938]
MIGEQHYSEIFQALPTPCVVLLPNAPLFTVVNVSDTYLKITNTNREDMLGRGFFDVFPTNPYQNESRWNNIFDEVIQTKKTTKAPPQKYVFPAADNPSRLDIMYLEVVNKPVFDDRGEIKFIIRSMTDVTDSVHDEKFFDESQRTARIGSWEVNLTHQVVIWSEGLREIYEVTSDYDPKFDHLGDFFPDPAARHTFEHAFAKASKDGTVFRFTLPMVTAKGNDRWVCLVGKADLVNGTCVRIYGVTQDITESKRLTDLDDLEKRILEMSTQRDTPLPTILSEYILGIEALYRGMYCSILGVHNDRLVSWVAPSLPESYIASVHDLPVADNVGSCGTAAYRKERIIVSEIATDPKWADVKDLALKHHLKACWSNPIIDAKGDVIAVLGIYYKQAKTPDSGELLIIDRMSALLHIIIENRQNADRARDAASLMAQGQELARFGNWQWDIELNKVSWSNVLYDIYGVDPQYPLSFESYLAQVHKDDRERIISTLTEVQQTGEDAVFEERIVRSDGETRHLRSWSRLVVDDKGISNKMIGACLDITETKQAELQLKQLHSQLEKHLKEVERSEKRYSDLFHLSPQPMWVYDLKTYRFLDVNAAAIAHYGYTREEFLSMTLMDIPPPEGIAKLQAAAELARENDQPFSKGIFTHRKKNGEIIKVERQSNIIQFHGRRAELVLLQDITLKLYYIEAIETQNKKLQEIAWMQSHMVRAPLARIMGLVDLIQMGPSPAIDQHQLLRAIRNSATELDQVLGNITEKAEQVNLT